MSGDKLYTSSYVREEDGKRIQLSGRTYVPMRCWEQGDYQFGPVKIKLPKHCEHGITVCEECVYSWSWDHKIAFHRTVGGRRLLEKIEANPQMKARVHFTDRPYDPKDGTDEE